MKSRSLLRTCLISACVGAAIGYPAMAEAAAAVEEDYYTATCPSTVELHAIPSGAVIDDHQRECLSHLVHAEDKALVESYSKRERTVLEQVLNYTSTGKEDGSIGEHNYDFWIAAKDGCSLQHVVPRWIWSQGTGETKVLGGMDREVNIRDMRPNAWRVQIAGSHLIVGDEKTDFSSPLTVNPDRLAKAWGIAFAQCPGKKTPF